MSDATQIIGTSAMILLMLISSILLICVHLQKEKEISMKRTLTILWCWVFALILGVMLF